MLAGIHSFAMSEAMFYGCIAIAILMPKVGVEASIFSGDLSRPFRQCIFVFAITLTARCLLLPDRRFSQSDCQPGDDDGHCRFLSWVYFSWTVAESILVSFLRLCMPYLLQRQLRSYINIVPGRDLQTWLLGVVAVYVVAIYLSANVAPQYWSIKRAGDGVLAIPVLRSVSLYRKVMKTRDETASFVLLDTVIALEFCYLLSVEGAALGYALDDRGPNNDVNEVWVAFRVASVYVGYVSVLLHGLVLAIIDEGQLMSRTY